MPNSNPENKQNRYYEKRHQISNVYMIKFQGRRKVKMFVGAKATIPSEAEALDKPPTY